MDQDKERTPEEMEQDVAAQDEAALRRVDKEDLPDTEATPNTDVSTTDAALEEGAPDSSGAIDKDAAEEAGENAGG